MSNQSIFLLILLLFAYNQQQLALSSPNSSTSLIASVCKSTPYPNACIESLKLSVSININALLHQSLKVAISEGVKLLDLLSNTNVGENIHEKQRGTIQDCNELHQITLSSLNKSLVRLATSSSSNDSNLLADVKAFLAAAVTNKNTCLEGLHSASGPLKPLLVDTITDAYKHVTNSLSLVASCSKVKQKLHTTNKRMALPKWLSRKDSKIFRIGTHNVDGDDDNDDDDDDDDDDDYNSVTVAMDGSGNFTTITNAINFVPNNSVDRVIIYY